MLMNAIDRIDRKSVGVPKGEGEGLIQALASRRFNASRCIHRLAWMLALACGMSMTAHADPKRDPQVEADVREFLERDPDFLLRNPDLVERSMELARQREVQLARVRTGQLLQERAPLLRHLSQHLGEGARRPSIQILAFTDYECLPCRANEAQVRELLISQPDIRVVHVPLGILSAASAQASAATLATVAERKSLALHRALMKAPLPLDYDAIMKEAAHVGISNRQLTSDMRAARTDELRDQIRMLSEALGVVATPTYLIGCELIRGPIESEALDRSRSACEPAGAARPACCEPVGDVEN